MCSGGLKAIHCSFFLEDRETDPSPDAALCLCQLTAFSHRFWTRKTKVKVSRSYFIYYLIIDVGTFSIFLIFIVSSRPYWKPAGVFTLLNRLA